MGKESTLCNINIPDTIIGWYSYYFYLFCDSSRGMTTIDIALTNVDINQCDKGSEGKFQFEIFAGTHRCKNETTQVRQLHMSWTSH